LVKNKTMWVGITVWGWIVVASASAEPVTLDDYYAAALKRSEVVATQAELITQAEERYRQARAASLLTVDGIATRTWTDSGARDTTSNPRRQNNSRITATQPLFRGFRDIAGLRQTKALRDAQNEEYRHARVQLFKDVSQNFFDVLSFEQELKNLDEQINLSLKRERELQDRVRIGRSRGAEVSTIQSSISTLRAEILRLRAQLSASREAFAFLSGLPANVPLNDTETLPAAVAPLDDYLARLDIRSDIKASRERLTAAQEAISVARGEHLPTLDLHANRYLERSGSLENVEWDVQLELIVPLYRGGATRSRVRESVSQRDQAELEVSQVSRQAEQEIRSLYEGVLLDRPQIDALEKATDAARKNYDAQVRDYRYGLVTNLEVLQALTAYQENQRALDRARYTAKLNYLRLEAAAMNRPALPENTP
jgi:outer membrane protein